MYTKSEPNVILTPTVIISDDVRWTDAVTNSNVNTTKTGEKVPDWRQRIRDGSDATSDYDLDAWKVVSEDGSGASCSWSIIPTPTNPSPRVVLQSVSGFVFPRAPFGHIVGNFDVAEATALRKIYKKIEAGQQQMKSLSFFAEFVDVLRQFGSPLHAVLKNYDRHLSPLEKRYWALTGSAKHRSDTWRKIIADTYLEWSFGMVPLLSDMRAASEALARFNLEPEGLQKFKPKLRLSSRGEATVSTHYTTGPNNISNTYMVYNYVDQVSTLRGVQYTCGMHGSPTADFGSNERLLELYGVDLRKVPEALWEAFPWSWLVDYATNVGDIISAGCSVTTDVSWTCRSSLTQTTKIQAAPVQAGLTVERIVNNGRIGSCSAGYAGFSEMVRTTMSRRRASLGFPPLVFDLDLNMSQEANLAAVLLSKASKPKPWSPY